MTPFAPKAAGSPATPTEAVPDRSELERHVYAGQVELLYQNGPIAFIFTLICGASAVSILEALR